MFKLSDATDTYHWAITVKMPFNGSYKKLPVKVTYNRLPHDERVDLQNQINDAVNDADSRQDAENNFFNKVFAGWADGQVKDEEGNDLEVNEGNKQALLGITEFRTAVMDGYFDSIEGNKIKQKN
ncbi:hypothetical protein VH441_07265 [Psychrobacter sp. HD31]|uniref:hypothetical protein n=1 Tax=Psychrobacter sp. HD31 TaxID=3112003 RepID=UPI003DA26015